MTENKRTPVSSLGKVAFIEKLISPFRTDGMPEPDDAAVIARDGYSELVSVATMLEGIDFDLTYFPLQHLGYKSVVKAVSNIYAMNGTPQYLTVGIGLSARFSVEDAEALYEGIRRGCGDYSVTLAGGNTSPSLTGLTIALTAIGRADDDKVVRRSGAGLNDIVCVSGNFGAAYMGLQLLEREKRSVGGEGAVRPELEGHEYILERQLKPAARADITEALNEAGIVPTAMIDVTSGLASAALHICNSSDTGIRIYLDRIPISSGTFAMAEEMGIDPVVAALNGGDDFELLFTVPLNKHQEVLAMGGVDVIGHMVAASKGAALTTPDGSEITITSPDFTSVEQ